jgi:hypothetical protein
MKSKGGKRGYPEIGPPQSIHLPEIVSSRNVRTSLLQCQGPTDAAVINNKHGTSTNYKLDINKLSTNKICQVSGKSPDQRWNMRIAPDWIK